MTVTEWLEETAERDIAQPGRSQDTAAGILVHRLFQCGAVLEGCDPEAESTFARALLKPEERASLENVDATVAAGVAVWRAMRAREDVAAWLKSGRVVYEVPFSMMATRDGSPLILRGTIDCLIHKDDGSIVVLEFKTGRARASHQRQLDLYVEAARALFPASPVEGHVVYALPT